MPTQTLQRIAQWGVRHYLRIFVCAALVFAASMIASSRLQVDSDVLNLLPAQRRWSRPSATRWRSSAASTRC